MRNSLVGHYLSLEMVIKQARSADLLVRMSCARTWLGSRHACSCSQFAPVRRQDSNGPEGSPAYWPKVLSQAIRSALSVALDIPLYDILVPGANFLGLSMKPLRFSGVQVSTTATSLPE